MKRIFHFRLPLKSPLVLRHTTLTKREGIIVELYGTQGRVGYGECSPLPGFFHESLEDCIRWLSSRSESARDQDYDSSPPSLRSAINQARLWLQCVQEGHDPLGLLRINRTSLPVNALLAGSRAEIIEKAKRCAAEGFVAAKLKVGRQKVEDDITLVNEVRGLLPDSVSLRLDANQSWSWEHALYFAESIDWNGIEYCEEPLADPQFLPRMTRLVPGARIALDESYTELGEHALSILPHPSAVILRPQLLGGIDRTCGLMVDLSKRGIPVTISSAVESSMGMMGVMLCGLSAPEPLRPAGLDTLSWLSADSITPSLAIVDGCILWPTWWNSFSINEQFGEWHEL